MITREDIFEYVRATWDTIPDYPWPNDPGHAVLRHPRGGKWFGLIMTVPGDKLGLIGTDPIEIINLKCDPDLIDFIRNEPGVLPAYHMNKQHWISILLDSPFPREEILHLISLSHQLTAGSV